MKTYNSKIDFIKYCWSNWLKQKDAKLFLKLLEDFIIESAINKWKFVLTWLFTIYTWLTTTTLKQWTFKKVKIRLTEKITYLFSKKW